MMKTIMIGLHTVSVSRRSRSKLLFFFFTNHCSTFRFFIPVNYFSAYGDDYLSVYNDEWCSYANTQLHEVGHNLGLDHSGLPGEEYGDTTGFMGYGSERDDDPKDLRCFNAVKVSCISRARCTDHLAHDQLLYSSLLISS